MNRKSWIIVGAVTSFVVLVCCVCAVGGLVWWANARNGPEAVVEQYLTAVRDRDTVRAQELTCERKVPATQLLTLLAEPVDWEILDSQTHDTGSAEVTVRVTFDMFGFTHNARRVFALTWEDDRWRVCGLRSPL